MKSIFLNKIIILHYLSIIFQVDISFCLNVLPKCIDHEDFRTNLLDPRFLNLPQNLLETDTSDRKFLLTSPGLIQNCDNRKLLYVRLKEQETTRFASNYDNWATTSSPCLTTKQYFTSKGDFYDNCVKYDPTKFCVKTLTDYSMEINVCRQVITISKCCLTDFIYDIVLKKCVKLPTGRKPWVPTLCIGDHCSSASSFGKYEFVPPRFRYCSTLVPLRSSDLQIESVSTAGYNLKANCRAKLEIGSGVVELFYLPTEKSKEWQKHEGEHCADGLITNSSATYDPDLMQQQFVFKCEASKSGELDIPIYYWINLGALVYSSFILLIIIVVYLLLFDKQNFQGLLILSCCISMFFMHVLNVLGTFDVLYYFTTFSRFIKGNNTVCKTVAIGWHYFFLCNLAWFIMINYDLWRTVHPNHLIQPSRHFKKFLKYSLIAWGIPGVLVTVFTLTDTFWSEVLPTPGYGERTCFPKRSGMARFYISGPLITTLTINSFFAISIVVKLLKSSRESKLLTINSSERYTARFFLKLFCITGLAWLCPFVSVEVHQYNGGVDIAFLNYLVIATLVIQSTGMLVLLCFNERTLQQVSSKFPRADGFIKIVRRL